MSNVTAFPTSASRGASGAPGGSCRSTISSGGARAAPADGGERAEPGLAPGRSISTLRPRKRRGALGEARRARSTFGGASTSSRAALVQRATSAARSATGARSSSPPQITKRSTPRGRLAASPAAAVVAADDGAFGQRAHLLLDGNGQRRVERPRDRPAAAARAHRPRGGGSQSLDVGLERDDGERGAVRVHDRDRVGVRHRALRGAQLRGPRSRRDATRSAPIASTGRRRLPRLASCRTTFSQARNCPLRCHGPLDSKGRHL